MILGMPISVAIVKFVHFYNRLHGHRQISGAKAASRVPAPQRVLDFIPVRCLNERMTCQQLIKIGRRKFKMKSERLVPGNVPKTYLNSVMLAGTLSD